MGCSDENCFPHGGVGGCPPTSYVPETPFRLCMSLVQQFDIESTITLGTLAANTAILGVSQIDAAREQGFRITRSRILFSVIGKSAGTSEGPLILGVCLNVPTVAALEAIIEADPQGMSSAVLRAKNAYVRIIGLVGEFISSLPLTGDDDIQHAVEIDYGKNGWSIPEGSALNYWVFNKGNALTTGGFIKITAEHFGVWLKD